MALVIKNTGNKRKHRLKRPLLIHLDIHDKSLVTHAITSFNGDEDFQSNIEFMNGPRLQGTNGIYTVQHWFQV